MPALRGLARAYPGHRRVLATPLALEPLALLSGAVHAVVDTRSLAPLDPALHGAEAAVNLHGRGPESHRLLVDARPRRLVAFAHAEVPESAGGPAWAPGEHEVARWCRMLSAHGIRAHPRQLDLPPPPAAPPPGTRGATILHPGAASRARRWPAERFAAVAGAEIAAGRRVIVTGGPGEAALAREVAAAAGLPSDAVLAGRTRLTELAALVAVAGRVVCGDTGVAHLATALRTPSVVLFGPTSPAEWGPPSDRPWHRTLWSGQRGDPHAHEPHPGLLRIDPADVVSALAELPDRSDVPAPEPGLAASAARATGGTARPGRS